MSARRAWNKFDEEEYLYSSHHCALVGRDLMQWQLAALDWIDEVFRTDRRDRKAMRRFIVAFVYRVEAGKRLQDGRQFALLSMQSLADELGIGKATAQKMLNRALLTGSYARLRKEYEPIIEIVSETLRGARAGQCGTGYAPIYVPINLSDEIEEPGSKSAGETEPAVTGRGSASMGNAEPVVAEAGSVSETRGSVFVEKGTVFQEKAEPSVISNLLKMRRAKQCEKKIEVINVLAPQSARDTFCEMEEMAAWQKPR